MSNNLASDPEPSLVSRDANYSKKRRKLSMSSASSSSIDIAESAAISKSIPPMSRIKPKENPPRLDSSIYIEQAIVSNGKIVDAQSSFATLEVAPWLIASLAAMAIQRPTAIQKGCIPEILAGRDVIGGSRTGSGKTVAFAVPILQMWAEDPMGIFALVLTPTR
jgi:ATP-dependent RNA helicase DDX49/DBP8